VRIIQKKYKIHFQLTNSSPFVKGGFAMPLPDQLFTSVNIVGLGMATAAVNLAANTLYRLFNLPPKWTAFGAALIIAYIVVAITTSPKWYDWVLAFFNACLLYCSALGINEISAAAFTPPGKGFAQAEGFFSSWLK
jgi:hypothetical protein